MKIPAFAAVPTVATTHAIHAVIPVTAVFAVIHAIHDIAAMSHRIATLTWKTILAISVDVVFTIRVVIPTMPPIVTACLTN